jgi:hypothetical protein
MLFAVSGLLGCSVDATDGRVGEVKDFLFDDQSWKIRWMVVDTGVWLPGRKLLVHPSAIDPLDLSPRSDKLPMMSGPEMPVVSVRLTKERIEGGPQTREDDVVTRQMEVRLYEYYGWDPSLGATYLRAKDVAPDSSRLKGGQASVGDADDSHLRGVVSVKGYHVHATDGDIGHVETFIADDVNWDIRYLVIATRNWLPGTHVQLAPFAVTGIDSNGRRVNVNVTRDQVKTSPPWDPLSLADKATEQSLHRHYNWPGYGW